MPGCDELIRVDDPATDPRWPELAKPEHRPPLRSVLSMPVHTGDCATQSLNLYAKPRYAFSSSQHPAGYLYGAAIGLALTALRVTSQHQHRKLREVADEVVYTGMLPSRRSSRAMA